MARRRSASRRESSRAPLPLPPRIEAGADGYDYEVRPIAASRATKTYRCPGCDHEIRSGTSHVVVWRTEGDQAGEDRRHWHTPCWQHRITRGPTRKWS